MQYTLSDIFPFVSSSFCLKNVLILQGQKKLFLDTLGREGVYEMNNRARLK